MIDSKKSEGRRKCGRTPLGFRAEVEFKSVSLGPESTASQTWADIVIGGRVQLPVGEKVVVDLLGDVGGWNATAKLDYQFAALLGYKIHPKWTLGAAIAICSLTITEERFHL